MLRCERMIPFGILVVDDHQNPIDARMGQKKVEGPPDNRPSADLPELLRPVALAGANATARGDNQGGGGDSGGHSGLSYGASISSRFLAHNAFAATAARGFPVRLAVLHNMTKIWAKTELLKSYAH